MNRVPIKLPKTNKSDESVPVRLVPAEMSISDFIPKYRYKFDADIPDEATNMYDSMIEFINENSDFIVDDQVNLGLIVPYSEGFKKAIAMVRLWIDSMYLNGGDKNG